ncbi:MAG TPA: hypothetical protein VM490_09495, partial [Armatimonadaceae bacterium]|nr:hypothetical protein [Armatimonadaceae bacterium]
PDPRPKKPTPALTPEQARLYREAVTRTAGMAQDPGARDIARRHGFDVLNLTWEDTGRYKNSAVGPNISDMTIQVTARDGRENLSVACMPVIRYPNFSDKSCDLDPRDFTLLVGNEKGRALRRLSLYEFLENPTAHLSNPDSWAANPRIIGFGDGPKSLLAPERDSKVLVSAQACFLPVPKKGTATFNPVLFNYQSYAKNPAVLTILATREGTSVTVIDNQRDAFETGAVWGQRLFHNAKGQRASLTGERASDFAARGGDATNPLPNPGGVARKPPASLSMVLLIQVPLKQKEQRRKFEMDYAAAGAAPAAPMAAESAKESRRASNVENAVIGHGDLEGPFTEIDDLPIERDPRFPVRVTVQFYKATDNGVVSEADLRAIKGQIDRVYAQSDYVGSLVTGGETGRATEYAGAKVQPPDWWERFWDRYERDTGVGRDEAVRRLRALLGESYRRVPVSDLYLRNVLRERS